MNLIDRCKFFIGDVAIIAQHAGPCYDVVNSGKSVMVTFFGHVSYQPTFNIYIMLTNLYVTTASDQGDAK